MLKRILKKYFGNCGLDSSGSGQVPVPDSCEDGNVASVSMKCVEFLD